MTESEAVVGEAWRMVRARELACVMRADVLLLDRRGR